MRSQLINPVNRLHLNQVHYAFKITFATDRQLDGDGVSAQAFFHLLDDGEEIRTNSVKFVHEGYSRNAIFVGLSPDRFALGFHASDPAKDSNHSVQNPQSPFNFCSEINMPRCVNDVDSEKFVVMEPAPVARSGCCDYGDASLFFLRHPVHCRCPFINAPEAVNSSRVKQDSLCCRRFTRIYVRCYSDVASFVQREFTIRHSKSLQNTWAAKFAFLLVNTQRHPLQTRQERIPLKDLKVSPTTNDSGRMHGWLQQCGGFLPSSALLRLALVMLLRVQKRGDEP